MKNYYKILQIDPAAEEEVIRGAYQRLSQKYHPDRSGGDQAKMAEINEAKVVLLDPLKKEAYDQQFNQENSRTSFEESIIKNEEHSIAEDDVTERPQKANIKLISAVFLLIVLGVSFWFYSLGSAFFYGLFHKVSYYSGWATIVLVVLFLMAEMDEPKKDGRYRTGYKNNQIKTHAPWQALIFPIGIWLISQSVLYFMPEPNQIDEDATLSGEQNSQLVEPTIKRKIASQPITNTAINDSPSNKETEKASAREFNGQEVTRLSSPVTRFSPSFDCAKASVPVELMICSSKELADADTQLAETYKQKYNSRPLDFLKKQIEHGQADWIANVRNACQDEVCLLEVYKQRIEYFLKPDAPVVDEVCAIPGHC